MSSAAGFGVPFQQAFEGLLVSPQTSWARFFNPQFSINYNAGDVEVENNVLERVGSYGHQLARILDVASVLVARLPVADLTPEERRYVDGFHDLYDGARRAVAEVKGERGARLTFGDVDRLVEELRSLESSDPAAHRALVARLREALPAEPG